MCGDVKKKKKKNVCSGKVDRLVDFGDVRFSGGIYLFFFPYFFLLNIPRNDYQKPGVQESTSQRDIIRQHLIM